MADLIWKASYLYFRKIYVGRIRHLMVGDHSHPEAVDNPWRALIHTGPSEAVVGWYPTENAAKIALEAAVKEALAEEAA